MKSRKEKMSHKERILSVLENGDVDRIPVDIWCTPEIIRDLQSYFKVQNEFDVFSCMGLDKIVWVHPKYSGAPEGIFRWGAKIKKINTGASIYHEVERPSLKGYDKPESIEDFPNWPDPDKFEYDEAVMFAEQAFQNYATLGPWVSFFEVYCIMRGMEQAMIDLIDAPELVITILDKIEFCQTEMMKRLFERASKNISMVFVSDDMGSQHGLLISMDLWDKYFKERMKRWCDLIHSYGIKVFYHSDGAVEPLIPRLIDCGIDILNPIQHVCPGMEMIELKKKYGNKLIFHGGVDNQKILPFGTPQDVRKETLQCLESLGNEKKGYICCSCHNIQAGTPVENIVTMVETVRNSG